ncbi:MAG: hypothetical protein LBG72_07695 [Spirochaetaceae bacterium]|nr:hypothetical protein [Spirochaetaceae bacterium]
MKIDQRYKDLFFTLINQLWRLVSAPITLMLIPLFLPPDVQGYWYLFGSIAAFGALADMGFTTIILQFTAHEFAFLSFNKNNILDGDETHLKRLGSFFKFSVKWFFTLGLTAFFVMYIAGFAFFLRDGVFSKYWFPWTIYAFAAMLLLVLNAVFSFIEGLNKIETAQKMRIIVSVVNTIILAGILAGGGQIYALSLGMLTSVLAGIILIFAKFSANIKQLINASEGFKYNWKKDVLPLLTKYAVSNVCVYFMFTIYTPVTHYFYGPVFSGKTGISITLVLSLVNFSGIWIYTVIPKINMLVSKRLWNQLDMLFRKRFLCVMAAYICGVLGLFGFLLIFRNWRMISQITSRFLPLKMIIMLFTGYFIQSALNCVGVYLRGHKQDPLVLPAAAAAVWTAALTVISGKFLPPEWIFTGFLSSYVFLLPVNAVIFVKCRKNWHSAL